MVKQDYLVRMIQEIISAIARAILNKKKIRQQDRDEYDAANVGISLEGAGDDGRAGTN